MRTNSTNLGVEVLATLTDLNPEKPSIIILRFANGQSALSSKGIWAHFGGGSVILTAVLACHANEVALTGYIVGSSFTSLLETGHCRQTRPFHQNEDV